MPVYLTPRHGVSMSEAIAEAATVAPVTTVILSTFEFWHPVGTAAGAIYVVNDRVDFIGVKEAGAARDDGVPVTFMAGSIGIERSEESDSARAPALTLSVGNVSGFMSDAQRAARGSLIPWEVIERAYAANDPTGPAILPPLHLFVSSVGMTAQAVSMTCSYGDPANVSIPTATFRRAQYPGLVR